ncbi:MAG: hypothetical protein MUF87_06105 [Anaerolineae bacterium]|jgi:hypothetical protein|nr:hypothetical protein [Anaerolineae bacterium]
MAHSLVQKLQLKEGYQAAVINAPEHYRVLLGVLPTGVKMSNTLESSSSLDWLQVFVRSIDDLEQNAPTTLAVIKPNTVLWFTYPKKTGKIKTDITRDIGWEILINAGWDGVTQISVDDTWSALRFRPIEQIIRRGTLKA